MLTTVITTTLHWSGNGTEVDRLEQPVTFQIASTDGESLRRVRGHCRVGGIVPRSANLEREVDDAVTVRDASERHDVDVRSDKLGQIVFRHTAACFDQHVRKPALYQPRRFAQRLHTSYSYKTAAKMYAGLSLMDVSAYSTS